jgi:hypothetical protein
MENELYEERRQLSKIVNNQLIEKISLKKKVLFQELKTNDLININGSINATTNSVKSTSSSSFRFFNKLAIVSQKYSIKKNLEEEPTSRKDNFGNEIKKGGMHKIAFADELNIIQSIMPMDKNKNSKNNRIYSPSKNLGKRSIFPIMRIRKRSSTINNSRTSMMKSLLNLTKNNTNKKRQLEGPLVDVINVECIKNETKLNTYSIKNRIINGQEQETCCTCYCSIF